MGGGGDCPSPAPFLWPCFASPASDYQEQQRPVHVDFVMSVTRRDGAALSTTHRRPPRIHMTGLFITDAAGQCRGQSRSVSDRWVFGVMRGGGNGVANCQ